MKNKGKKCSVNTCTNNAICKSFCWKHYQQKRLRGEIKEKNCVFIEDFCNIIGCGKKIFAKGKCQKHYLEEKN